MKDINIIIPAAGSGERFKSRYSVPKPLVEVCGKKLIQWSVDSLGIDGNLIFIAQRTHDVEFGIEKELKSLYPDSTVILLDEKTDGAARTVLMAKDLVNNNQSCIVTNSDQYYEYDVKDFMDTCIYEWSHGILTFPNNNPKWSYCKVHEWENVHYKWKYVDEVAEKRVISNHATVGTYFFMYGSAMIYAVEEMIRRDIRHNGEFYFAPCYNILIEQKESVICYDVDKMRGLGTCDDVDIFIKEFSS
jgi:choline kinase